MIVAVHQPQYLPWLGYFHKIAKCDLFIFLDDVQYKKREFQNRNKIKTPNGPLWLTVPVLTHGAYSQAIKEVKTDPTEHHWTTSHWKSIEMNYRHSPFFKEHAAFFEELYKKQWGSLMEVSLEIIRYTSKYLGINTPVKMSSEYSVTTLSTQRIIDLCKASGASAYLSGAGGRDYMDTSLFSSQNIGLDFQQFDHPKYPQLHGEFEPYLSIIDLLFNCGPDSRKILLGN
jgi:hypothetical protein